MAELRGKPRGPREGRPIWSNGRQVTAGLAPFERPFSPRSTPEDLWAALDASCDDSTSASLAKALGSTEFRSADSDRYRSFVRQAREFYTAQRAVSPAAKPLAAYYFVLNLSKAFLTLAAPSETRADKLMHGVAVEPGPGGSYAFELAKSRAYASGVFPLLAARTGAASKKPVTNPIAVVDLLPYLLEATHEYSAASGQLPRLLEVESVSMLQSDGNAWLRLEIPVDSITRRGLRPKALAEQDAGLFAEWFDFVGNDDDRGVSVYESTKTLAGSRRRSTWDALAAQLDSALVGLDRSQLGGRWFVTLDPRTGLLSYEAVTFLLMHHLSEMARYRPQLLDEMLSSKHAWVLTTWVNRACENLLLTLASRITREEHRIRG